MNAASILMRFYKWRIKHVSSRNFLILLSLVIGICGGVAALTLRSLVHQIEKLLTDGFNDSVANVLYFIYPLAGILLTVVYKYYFNKNRLGAGIPNLLYTIAKKSSLVPRDQMYSHIISSALTVGLGGSVGLEAPIVTTGAAFGSNLGRIFHVGYKKRTLLIGCGAAAAIAGIFGAPIAGVLFTLEVLLLELTIPAFIPLLISAVTGALIPLIFKGKEVIFSFTLSEEFHYAEVPFYVLLGIFVGLISVYFHRNMEFSKKLFARIENKWSRALIGGIGIGVFIFILPPLYGEGYEAVKSLLAGNSESLLDNSLFTGKISNPWFLLVFAVMLILVKVFATGFTISAGGNGGVFAPSMFSGAISGFVVAKFFNLLGFIHLSEKNFVMVGMAGFMSALLHAPLTAIFLIAEVTGGYGLIIPLMLVSAISYATNRYFEKYSHYTQELADKGGLHFHDKDKTVLNIMKIDKLLETEFTPVNVNGYLKDIVEAVTYSKRNIYPVIDDEGKFHGVVTLDDIRQIMFNPEKQQNISISDIMHRPSQCVNIDETMEEVMSKFDESGYWNLPVIEGELYRGFLSKSKIFNTYRGLLKKETDADTAIID